MPVSEARRALLKEQQTLCQAVVKQCQAKGHNVPPYVAMRLCMPLPQKTTPAAPRQQQPSGGSGASRVPHQSSQGGGGEEGRDQHPQYRSENKSSGKGLHHQGGATIEQHHYPQQQPLQPRQRQQQEAPAQNRVSTRSSGQPNHLTSSSTTSIPSDTSSHDQYHHPTPRLSGRNVVDQDAVAAVPKKVADFAHAVDTGIPADGIDQPKKDEPMSVCQLCHRSFAVSRMPKHLELCKKNRNKKIVVNDPVAARKAALQKSLLERGIVDVDLENLAVASSDAVSAETAAELKKAKSWRNQQKQFSNAIKGAKGDEVEAEDLRVPCPFCHRKFEATSAERHIPKCNSNPAKLR